MINKEGNLHRGIAYFEPTPHRPSQTTGHCFLLANQAKGAAAEYTKLSLLYLIVVTMKNVLSIS